MPSLPDQPCPSALSKAGWWAKGSDGGQSQPSHWKVPLQTSSLAVKAARGARTGSAPDAVTNIIQTCTESRGRQSVDQDPDLGWWGTGKHWHACRVFATTAFAETGSGSRSCSSAAALGEKGEAFCFWLFISRPPAALLLTWPSDQEVKHWVLGDIQSPVSAVGS